MPKLILARHSIPQIDTSKPSSHWHLSEIGRVKCHELAERLAEHGPDLIFASTEPKAYETARIVADVLGKSCEVVEGLHEHVRDNVPFLNRDDFEARIALFFQQPDRLVFGQETADQAHYRFSIAVANLLECCQGKNVAVVTHGTVLTLFVCRAMGLEPMPFWKQLGLPGFVTLSVPELHLLALEAI